MYPKIKIKKNRIKIIFKEELDVITSVVFEGLRSMRSSKLFILFIQKSLHF